MSELADDLKAMRLRVQRIKNTFRNTGTIEAEDLDFLCDRAVRFVTITHIAENDWVSLKALQVTSTLEIDDLVRQLDNQNGLR